MSQNDESRKAFICTGYDLANGKDMSCLSIIQPMPDGEFRVLGELHGEAADYVHGVMEQMAELVEAAERAAFYLMTDNISAQGQCRKKLQDVLARIGKVGA